MGVWMRISKSDKVVCSVVGSLGLLAALLGFAAAKHVRPEEVEGTMNEDCSYPKSYVSVLGITAAVALLMAQVIGNAVGGCVCCTCGDPNPPRSNRTIAILCLVVSWITFTIAFILLIGGAINSSKKNVDVKSSEHCNVVKSGVFASGAVLALVTTILIIVYYFKASTIKNSSQFNPHNYNISMGEPQYGYPNVDARASKV